MELKDCVGGTSSPVELLWFRLPRLAGDPEETGIVSPRFGKGQILLMIDRADHWQVGLFFAAGDYPRLHAEGVAGMQRRIVELEPRFAENVRALTECFASYATALRADIAYATEVEDAGSAALYTDISRGVDQRLGFLDAYLHHGGASTASTRHDGSQAACHNGRRRA